jgi:hypothetical protein
MPGIKALSPEACAAAQPELDSWLNLMRALAGYKGGISNERGVHDQYDRGGVIFDLGAVTGIYRAPDGAAVSIAPAGSDSLVPLRFRRTSFANLISTFDRVEPAPDEDIEGKIFYGALTLRAGLYTTELREARGIVKAIGVHLFAQAEQTTTQPSGNTNVNPGVLVPSEQIHRVDMRLLPIDAPQVNAFYVAGT